VVDVAVQASNSGQEEVANMALYMYPYRLGTDAPERFTQLLSSHAGLRSLHYFPEIAQQLDDHGYLGMF
jgi:hypothetical protein